MTVSQLFVGKLYEIKKKSRPKINRPKLFASNVYLFGTCHNYAQRYTRTPSVHIAGALLLYH